MSKKETWSYDFSWTQPYVAMNGFYNTKSEAEQEIERLNETDRAVDLMDRYPDAEAMIERLKKDYLDD